MTSRPGSPRFWGLSALALVALAGCQPGYIKPADLERQGQGPSACAKTCEELGMKMGALVLVGDTLPGCVCQPLPTQPSAPPPSPAPAPAVAPPAPAAPAAPPAADDTSPGASAVTTGFVVLAAAVAARHREVERKRQAAPVNY